MNTLMHPVRLAARSLTVAEVEALVSLAEQPWNLSSITREGWIAAVVLRGLVHKGLASMLNVDGTTNCFVITGSGRAALM